MRHSSSTHFSGIPIDTNTLAGQWMTFSHMANHYRKLLNVKPRVDTGQPTNHHHGSFHNFSSLNNNNSSTKMQSSKSKSISSGNAKSSSASNAKMSNSTNGGKSLCYQTIRRDNIMYGSHPEHLNHVSGKPSPQFLIAKESIGKAKAVIESSKCVDKSRNAKTKNQHQQPNQVFNYPDYQVVFGPSSIRSSTDAFMSEETDSSVSGDKPLSEVHAPLGVSEKIRHFLNNIHQLDLKPSSSKKKKCKRVTTDPTANKSKSIGDGNNRTGIVSPTPNSFPPSVASSATNHQIDFRLSRHSRCFLPYEPNNNLAQPPPKSPKRCQAQKAGNSTAVTPTKSRKNKSLHEPMTPTPAEKHLSSPLLSLNRKQGKSKISTELEGLPTKTSRLSRNKFTGSGMDIHIPEKDTSSSVKRQGKIRKRAGSIASIGTICGSEELAPEDFPLNIRDIYSTHDDDVLLSKILEDHLRLQSTRKVKLNSHHHDRHNNHSSGVSSVSTTNLLKSNSMASLIPEAGRGSATKPSTTGAVNNNKDSSRDSAYGFSSGESRITTRESTPEKKCLNELDTDLHKRPSKDLKESSCSSRHKIRHRSSADEVQLKRKDSSEKYINFLAELTQDIVSKGIYTNKGLKTLFKAQLEQNKDLDKNKLSDMLERLRTDLGIPKDDALDKIEFGYGSISNATSTTFFYTPPSPHEKLSTDSVILNANAAGAAVESSSKSGDVLLEESSASASPSPTTIIPCIPNVHVPASHHTATTATTTTTGFSSGGPNTSSNRSTTTTDEGSGDLISVPGSDDNQAMNIHDDDEDDIDDDEFYDEDELSLSETEVTQALKIAGLNDAIAEEVVGMLKS